MTAAAKPQQTPEEFEEFVASFRDNPLGFVEAMFDWGHGDLAEQSGPDKWQRQFLIDLGEEVVERDFDGLQAVMPVLMAVGSGHGIGKSALVAWLILWIMSTRPMCRGTVTASTVTQLETKTIPELAKWHKRIVNSGWFRLDTTKIVEKNNPKQWNFTFQTARKENSEAFAGQHVIESSSVYIFDESSGVPDQIFEVAEGGLTDGEPMWFCFGNRTKPTGRFNDCFGRFAHRWINYTIDSRQAKMTNKAQIQAWADDWGEDSDFFRVRVLGKAPGQAAEQLISLDSVKAARIRVPNPSIRAPMLMGIDVARYGTHRSAFSFRKGDDARTHPPQIYRGVNTNELADIAAGFIRELKVNTVFVDGGGVGGGVVDRLVALGFQNIIEVNFGGLSSKAEYFNKRTEMWGELKKAIDRNLCIWDDDELQDDLLCQDYYIDKKSRRTRLIAKEDLHTLGLLSPDIGDSLALLYAMDTSDEVPLAGGVAGGVAGAVERQGWHPHDNLGVIRR